MAPLGILHGSRATQMCCRLSGAVPPVPRLIHVIFRHGYKMKPSKINDDRCHQVQSWEWQLKEVSNSKDTDLLLQRSSKADCIREFSRALHRKVQWTSQITVDLWSAGYEPRLVYHGMSQLRSRWRGCARHAPSIPTKACLGLDNTWVGQSKEWFLASCRHVSTTDKLDPPCFGIWECCFLLLFSLLFFWIL